MERLFCQAACGDRVKGRACGVQAPPASTTTAVTALVMTVASAYAFPSEVAWSNDMKRCGVVMKNSLRAIVIEDDFLLADMLADVLLKLGCEVLGCASNVGDGVQLAGESLCDFAIVDLDLKGIMAVPILDRLRDRGVPFLVATGAFAEDIPPPYLDAPRLSKPYDLREMQRALGLLMPDWSFRASVTTIR